MHRSTFSLSFSTTLRAKPNSWLTAIASCCTWTPNRSVDASFLLLVITLRRLLRLQHLPGCSKSKTIRLVRICSFQDGVLPIEIQVRLSFSLLPNPTLTHPSISSLLLHRPLITQCITAAVLFGAGDVIAQQGVERKGVNGHDVSR